LTILASLSSNLKVNMLDLDLRRIRQHAAAADTAGFLEPVQQALIHRRGWLRMLAPRAAGGMELPLPEVVRLEEAIAAADGSMGWVVTLCAGAGWFAGFLPPELAREIMGSKRVCLAGSGAPTGYADCEGDGYRITGRWDYASGAPMATHFTLNAILREGGQPLLDAHGAPRIKAFVVPAGHVTVLPTWHSIGMRGSASHSYSIDGAWVPASHGFVIDAEHATAPGALYRFPFYPLAYITLAANLAGMARHFIELARESISRRKHARSGLPLIEQPEVERLLREAAEGLAATRAEAYALLDRVWKHVSGGTAASEFAADVAALQDASLAMAAAARAAVDGLYPYCGLYAANVHAPINRVWRDFHTATQHSLFLP
jgi:alkylation response protein AidB-like acyl-CoA dehydrogenase